MRDITRDLVRGLNVLEMETVNLTETVLGHASIEDKSITYADTVFPTFAFLAGMSPTPWHRNVSYVGLGLVYNSFAVIYKGTDYEPRYVGVLQRTGLSSLLYNAFPAVTPVFPAVTTAVWYGLSILLAKDRSDPFAAPEDSAQTYIDTTVFDPRSLYTRQFDPEGLLGTLMTSVSIWMGAWYASSKLSARDSLIAGMSSISAGFALARLFPKYAPISKPYWSPTFTLIAGGVSIVKYAAVGLIAPHLPEQVAYGLSCVGRRSLEVYFSSALLHSVLRRLGVDCWFKSTLGEYIGPVGADLTYTGISNAIMVALAVLYVEKGVRLTNLI
jgi:predicted acyltransferase